MIARVTNKNTGFLNNSVMYQLFLRAFTPEGTFAAAERMLPHLAGLGIDIIYLCPCFQEDADGNTEHWSDRQKKSCCHNPKNPYRISDYYRIDEEYGSMEDFSSFVKTAHGLGMKVALDLVYYHCGPNAALISEHPEFIMRNDKGEPEMGEWHFPRLNFACAGLREYLLENMCFYVREYGIDGYRCDVGDGIPLDFWEEGRRRLESIKPDVFMLNEGVKPEYIDQAFDLNYETGWGMLLFKCMMADSISGAGDNAYQKRHVILPEQLHLKPNEVCEAWRIPEFHKKRIKKYEDEGASHYCVIRGIDNHDTVSDEYEWRKDRLAPAEVLTAELAFSILADGVPFLYNGVEICDKARHSIYSNRMYGGLCIDWSNALTPDGEKRLADVKRLIGIRHTCREVWEGETVWLPVSDEKCVAAFARVLGKTSVVTFANFTSRALTVEIDLSGIGEKTAVLFMNGSAVKYRLSDRHLVCDLLPHGCGVIRAEQA